MKENSFFSPDVNILFSPAISNSSILEQICFKLISAYPKTSEFQDFNFWRSSFSFTTREVEGLTSIISFQKDSINFTKPGQDHHASRKGKGLGPQSRASSDISKIGLWSEGPLGNPTKQRLGKSCNQWKETRALSIRFLERELRHVNFRLHKSISTRGDHPPFS